MLDRHYDNASPILFSPCFIRRPDRRFRSSQSPYFRDIDPKIFNSNKKRLLDSDDFAQPMKRRRLLSTNRLSERSFEDDQQQQRFL